MVAPRSPLRLDRIGRWIVAGFACAGLVAANVAAALPDDRAITVHSAREITAKRAALIQHVWGADGFPAQRLPETVVTNIPSPVKSLDHLARVDELRMKLAPGLEGLAYHFVPERPNGSLVVVHHGHACTLDDDPGPTETGYGLQRTIKGLLGEGYGVLGVFMPRMRPGDCTGQHEAMFGMKTTGSPMRFFLEPVALGLNHVRAEGKAGRGPRYREFHMTGLSGGGWTTVVYAALDPTIRCSIPVAGSIPLYLRSGGSVGDREQFDAGFYGLAGYPDLYVLGADGKGRRQIQVLVRRDDCCFGAAQHDEASAGLPYAEAMREYEGRVQKALKQSGHGDFSLVFDEVAPGHMISHHVIDTVILPALRASH